MKINAREYLPSTLNFISGIIVFFISFFIGTKISIPKEILLNFGIIIVVFGMLIVFWATIYIKKAILGEIEPKLNILVKNGPYRFIRHPVYLGMTIALLGVPVSLGNWLGIIAVFLLFLPSEINRAKLEENKLGLKFGIEWENYVEKTNFIFPFFHNFFKS